MALYLCLFNHLTWTYYLWKTTSCYIHYKWWNRSWSIRGSSYSRKSYKLNWKWRRTKAWTTFL